MSLHSAGPAFAPAFKHSPAILICKPIGPRPRRIALILGGPVQRTPVRAYGGPKLGQACHPTTMRIPFNAEQRRVVLKDWSSEFPDFRPKGAGLVRLVGPLLQGISFEGQAADWTYLPTTYVRDLSQPALPLRALVNQRLTTEHNGATDHIAVRWHKENYVIRASWLARSSVVPMCGSPTVKQVVRGFAEWSRNPKSCINVPIHQYLSGVRLFVWCGDVVAARQYLEDGLTEAASWPEGVVARLGGLRGWRDQMAAQLQNASVLHDRVRQRIKEMRLTKCPQFDLRC